MPVTGRVKLELNIENIMNKVSDYDIYRHYVGHDFTLGKGFISPFRDEENPSFVINIGKDNKLHHIDYGDSTRKGRCVDFVMQLLSCSYDTALKDIDRELKIGILLPSERSKPIRAKEVVLKQKEDSFIQVVVRRFDSAELSYWNQYHINEADLRKNDVYAIKKLYLNRRMLPLRHTELAFAYLFDDRWKIYRPYAEKKDKWITNVPNDRMSGLHRITDKEKNSVVTKSKKDEILLSKIIEQVCSVQSENTVGISKLNINLLSEYSKEIYLNFDNDEVGVQACKFYNQFGFKWVNVPKSYLDERGVPIKDFSDLAKYHGLEAVTKHFKLKGII